MYVRAAWPLGNHGALLVRASAELGTRGNVNYGMLLGSVDGVRGLSDAQYFNWVQVLSNVELRQSLRLGERWALQGVLFSDAAAFEQMTATGGRGEQNAALSRLSGWVGRRMFAAPDWSHARERMRTASERHQIILEHERKMLWPRL